MRQHIDCRIYVQRLQFVERCLQRIFQIEGLLDLQITKLRLLGFKSFVEPTELLIGRGLTGVVGPNGCGKSNLLEALRWVMGETSYKTMRASAMDDVIFSGTQTRPSRNSAEVSLFLDNSARTAPSEFNDSDTLEVTRRIEREIGSAYLINGRDTRARDVKLLFEDAATGARSNALVQQGQIGQVINAKPQQRRRLLEDAAGIAGLHSRRHEAELRLRAAETNLLRVADTLGQLTTQMNSLKRQARQARRYRELSEAIRRTEALFFHLSWQQICTDVLAEEAKLRDGLTEIASATKLRTSTSTKHLKISEGLAPLREEEAKCAAACQRLSMELGTLDEEAARLRERQGQIKALRTQTEQDKEREEQRQIEAETSLAKLAEEKEKLQTQSASVEKQHGQLETQHRELVQQLEKEEAALADLLGKIAEHRAEKTQLEAARQTFAGQHEKAQAEFERLSEKRKAILDASESDNPEQIVELGAALASLTDRVTLVEGETSTAEQRLAQHQERGRAIQETANKSQLAASKLAAEIVAIEKLLGTGRDREGDRALIDSVKVQEGHEHAFAIAFGEDLDASMDTAAAVHWTLTESRDDPKLPKSAEPLSAFVEAPDVLDRRLAQIGVVEQQLGPDLQFKLAPGQCLVSIEGDLWRWDGYIAQAGAQTPAAQRLAERNRLEALRRQQPEVEAAADRAEHALADARRQLEAAQDEERNLRKEWRTLQHKIDQARQEIASTEAVARQNETELLELKTAVEATQEKQAAAKQSADDLTQKLSALGDTHELEQQFEAAQTKATETRAAIADCAGKISGLDRETQLRSDRLKAIAHETEQWTHRKAQSRDQTASLKARHQALLEEMETLKDIPAQVEERRHNLLEKTGDAEEKRTQAADRLSEAETYLAQLAKELKDADTILASLREDKARTETRLENAREKRSALSVQISDALECNPEDCLNHAELEDADAPLPSFGEVERKLAKLRTDRERVGGVNLQADQELQDITAQHDELDHERADLEGAIAELRSAINKLNREGRKRLLEAFDEVNGHFQSLFESLFGGGTAELQLIDADDPLDAGLEIMARPPGKKQNPMSLLSGGEQALTALSLIFAVFLTNPSPICVLDEVDAPLDDANVDRFCKLLESMSAKTDTRFLVITHHPMTMSRMNRLFGVTMAERGVSQLVSVDLETAETYREAS